MTPAYDTPSVAGRPGPDHDDSLAVHLLKNSPQICQSLRLCHHIMIQGSWLHDARICYGAVQESAVHLGYHVSVCFSVGCVLNHDVPECIQQSLLVTRAQHHHVHPRLVPVEVNLGIPCCRMTPATGIGFPSLLPACVCVGVDVTLSCILTFSTCSWGIGVGGVIFRAVVSWTSCGAVIGVLPVIFDHCAGVGSSCTCPSFGCHRIGLSYCDDCDCVY